MSNCHNVLLCPEELWELIPSGSYLYVVLHDKSEQRGWMRSWTPDMLVVATQRYKTDKGYIETTIDRSTIARIYKEPPENATIEILLLVNSLAEKTKEIARLAEILNRHGLK